QAGGAGDRDLQVLAPQDPTAGDHGAYLGEQYRRAAGVGTARQGRIEAEALAALALELVEDQLARIGPVRLPAAAAASGQAPRHLLRDLQRAPRIVQDLLGEAARHRQCLDQ